MLATLGYASMEEMVTDIIPNAILSSDPLELPQAMSEQEALEKLKSMAALNKVYRSFIGQGYYNTHTPNVILRNVLENPGWYTAYTPYQSEISQGRLEALLLFQTMVVELTALDIANASLLDEATAAAEAMAICYRYSRSKKNRFFVDEGCYPQTIDVLHTRCQYLDIELVVGSADSAFADTPSNYFGILLQYPDVEGRIQDYSELIATAKSAGTLVVMAADILSLLLLKPPAALGVDIAIGTTQRFGVPLGFGGPHAAYIACREPFKRSMPGRIVGVSKDVHSQTAYRLALQTREQHIRREKATSNICTAQALLAIMAGFFAVYHGPKGLYAIANRVHRLTMVLAAGLSQLGYPPKHRVFFDTLTLETGSETEGLHQRARALGINLGVLDASCIRIALDETTKESDIDTLWSIFSGRSGSVDLKAILEQCDSQNIIPLEWCRDDAILTQSVFNQYHSETEMLRYLRFLASKDIALDQSMIPLGSCTMKLNASAEMLPISWPEFSDIHPLAPSEQTLGYQQLFRDLQQKLALITGYTAVSLQPNAGSQGEYAGLLAIRAYHDSRGESERTVCLIPASAHGTNPASAKMCGMEPLVVNCNVQGDINLEDLVQKSEAHKDRLAAIMITYPSTNGVFEDNILDICDIIHRCGGQIYIDGANLNALVGLCYFGRFGGDVSHLNLHKTFCIPHGGGGPGVGPIGVASHLAAFLPNQAQLQSDSPVGPVSASPWGSAGILPVTWMYLSMMGADLKQATQVAILNANYIAQRLRSHYPLLYKGRSDRVAHECVIDLRPFKKTADVAVEDIAKRLMDYGFHAPTMSFPVPGTLMIEPTESESKAEIDRFCDAMIAIRGEIEAIEKRLIVAEQSPLKGAPHTAHHLICSHWDRPYSREQGAYPYDWLRTRKYWPPVGRIDNAYGDRTLICTYPLPADE